MKFITPPAFTHIYGMWHHLHSGYDVTAATHKNDIVNLELVSNIKLSSEQVLVPGRYSRSADMVEKTEYRMYFYSGKEKPFTKWKFDDKEDMIDAIRRVTNLLPAEAEIMLEEYE